MPLEFEKLWEVSGRVLPRHSYKLRANWVVNEMVQQIREHANRSILLLHEKDISPSTRYQCSCDPIQAVGQFYRYGRTEQLELPDSLPVKAARMGKGLSPFVSIDGCITHAIQELWDNGVETLGCCCGHNLERAWVQVQENCYVKMFELGYIQRPVEIPSPGVIHGLYAFYL